MWGGVRAEEKWRPDRTDALGVAGRGEGFPCLEGPLGPWTIRRECTWCFPSQLGPGKTAGLPGRVHHPLRPPLGHVGPRGIGGRWGGEEERWMGGALQDQRIR